MAIIRFENGQCICRAGDALKELYVIGEGAVRASFPGGSLLLRKGDIIGIQDIRAGAYSCTCTAAAETALVPYAYTGLNQLLSLFQNKPNIMHLFFTASVRFSSSLLKYCAGQDARQISGADMAAASANEAAQPEENYNEEANTADINTDAEIEEIEEIEALPDPVVAIPDTMDDADIPPELTDSLSVILSYGGCEPEFAERFQKEVEAYKAMPDKDSTQDRDRQFRTELTRDFYTLYAAVFQAAAESLDESQPLPPAVRLFLTFGFVDAQLAGASNSAYLLSIADTYHGAPEQGVYTFYEWLTAVYEGDKEPSRNEFDLDYTAYLREQRVSGKITAKEEKSLLNSSIDRVAYELQNVFPIVNKMTFGRITTFCPLLSAHNLIKPLPDTIVTPQKITGALKEIREVDFSAFCRETVYADESAGVTREYLQVEVLPDVILMPNVGIRGAMWQEIEGKRRTTPARMMLSVIALENVSQLMIRMTGEFRWEMCKRIQGAYWNNIAERSLTSEYTDYAQFYKKNHDLSPDAKEKIRLSLQKAKNSIKELFVQDYAVWILYEGKGSPRMNKLARAILFTYCPFPAPIREKLVQHPIYRDLIDHYQLTVSQKLHHLDMLCNKIEKTGSDIPEEIVRQREFLES